MKSLFTPLFLLVATLTFAQSPLLYTYIDGNGNTYELYDGELKYIPMTPANSSSGTYSGGEAKNVVCTKIETQDLSNAFTACIAATAEQTKTNTMGTATIKYKKGNRKARIYMQASSATKTTLENALVAKKNQ